MTRSKNALMILLLIVTASVIPAAFAPSVREDFDDYTGLTDHDNVTITDGYITPITFYNESNFDDPDLYDIGYTQVNNGTQTYLWDENYSVNSTAIDGNVTLTAGAYVVYDFFLDNDQEETESVSEIYDDDETFWTKLRSGAGAYDIVISENTTEKIKGTSSLMWNITAGGAFSSLGCYHDYGSGQDWSSYDFICLYFYGVNTGLRVDVAFRDSDNDWGTSQSFFDDYNGWRRNILLLDPVETGNYELSKQQKIYVSYVWMDQPAITYMDRMVIDVGKWESLEFWIADEMTTPATNVKTYSWNGAAWTQFAGFDVVADVRNSWNDALVVFLDGTTGDDIYASNPQTISLYGRNTRNQIESAFAGNDGDITYSGDLGAVQRAAFSLRMPPDDGQDASDYGISQLKLRIQPYHAGTPDGITTYEHDTGYFYSVNVLENADSTLATSLDYSTLIQPNASIDIQFSQDNETWYDHNGIAEGWDTLENGTGSLTLSGLNWAGNLYRRINMTTGSTPRLLYLIQGYNVDQSIMIAGSITLWIFVVLALITFLGMVLSSSLVISVTAGALSFICWGVTALVYLYDNATGFTEPALLFGLFAAICGIYTVYAGMKLLNPYEREKLEDGT